MTSNILLSFSFVLGFSCSTQTAQFNVRGQFVWIWTSSRGDFWFLLQEKKTKQPDEVDADGQSLSGSEGGVSPKSSRRHFLQLMMSSSPQVRRSLVLRGGSDGDSVSLDDDRSALALDPLEHEWMLSASDGEWSSLQRLLNAEPSLVLRKDFITGFTCLHWAAKQGRPELLALIINFAKQNNIPLSVDVRSNAGYTPLHVAAMQTQLEVVKLLVGAYNANVEIRDYSGRKACQYLADGVSVDIREILGACPDNPCRIDRSRPSFSKVFHSNLRILGDPVGVEVRPWEKPLRRKSSFTKMRPQLEKLRRRASQIMHSSRFHEEGIEEMEEGPAQNFFHVRPKTHEFGWYQDFQGARKKQTAAFGFYGLSSVHFSDWKT